MSFPQVVIDIGKIRDNARSVVEFCKKNGVEVVGVTKGVCALPPIVGGVALLGGIVLLLLCTIVIGAGNYLAELGNSTASP